MNLLSNAIKYSPLGGYIELLVSRDETGTTIQVRDEGAGLSPEDLSRLYGRFSGCRRSRLPVRTPPASACRSSSASSSCIGGIDRRGEPRPRQAPIHLDAADRMTQPHSVRRRRRAPAR